MVCSLGEMKVVLASMRWLLTTNSAWQRGSAFRSPRPKIFLEETVAVRRLELWCLLPFQGRCWGLIQPVVALRQYELGWHTENHRLGADLQFLLTYLAHWAVAA